MHRKPTVSYATCVSPEHYKNNDFLCFLAKGGFALASLRECVTSPFDALPFGHTHLDIKITTEIRFCQADRGK